MTIYRKVSDVGILAASGAKISLPNVPSPMVRFISNQNGHLDVLDTASDGTTTTVTSWDISSLTAPYQPGEGSGPQPNAAGQTAATPSPTPNNMYVPDRLSKEVMFTTTTSKNQGTNPDANTRSSSNVASATPSPTPVPTTVALGSVFVDDANQIFYTPPTAPVVFPIPVDVAEITGVTHLAANNTIVANWIKSDVNNEDDYHMVTINTNSMSIMTDIMPDDSLHAQQEMAWVDNTHLLGRQKIHGAVLYSTINLVMGSVTLQVSTGDGQTMKISNGTVNTYTYADGD